MRTEIDEAEKQQREEREREEARCVKLHGRKLHRQRRDWSKKDPSTEGSESEMDTEDGGESSSSAECQSRHIQHTTNIYLTDSVQEARIMSFKTKPSSTLRTRPGRIFCGKDLQATATSQ